MYVLLDNLPFFHHTNINIYIGILGQSDEKRKTRKDFKKRVKLVLTTNRIGSSVMPNITHKLKLAEILQNGPPY